MDDNVHVRALQFRESAGLRTRALQFPKSAGFANRGFPNPRFQFPNPRFEVSRIPGFRIRVFQFPEQAGFPESWFPESVSESAADLGLGFRVLALLVFLLGGRRSPLVLPLAHTPSASGRPYRRRHSSPNPSALEQKAPGS